MSKLIVNGGRPLIWTATPVPNKNSVIKLIAASMLTDQEVILENVPQSSDVMYLLEIIEKLWWQVTRNTKKNWLTLCGSGINSHIIDPELSQKMKTSVMLVPVLLHRFWKAEMPTPQWCKLWTRPLDVVVENMEHLWAIYRHESGNYYFDLPEKKKLTAKDIRQRFPSVTWTEMLIVWAVVAEWQTTIYNAACEPHVQDLCNMLNSMWANITWIWSNKLIIQGTKKMHWTHWTVQSDHLDVWWFIAASVMTWWEITIRNAWIQHMGLILQMFEKLWVRVETDIASDTIFVPKKQILEIIKTVKGNPWRTHALHRPLLPADFVHTCVVVALKAKWQAIFDNLFYEYWFFFVQELAKMKANIIMANPVTVITTWPTDFKAADLVCSDIIQASFGLLMAALAAPGTSTLNAVSPLFRRFPNFVEQYNALGADLELVD